MEPDSTSHCRPSLARSPPLLRHSRRHRHHHSPLSVTTRHGSQALSKDEDLTQRASSLGMHCDGVVYLHTQVVCIYTFCARTHRKSVRTQAFCVRLVHINLVCSHKYFCARYPRHFVCAITCFVRTTLILYAQIFAPLGPPYDPTR